LTAALPTMIACENGLGRLTAYACGRRWGIANGTVALAASERGQASAIINSPCRDCTYGKPRAAGVEKREAPTPGDGPLQSFACEKCGDTFRRAWSGRGRKPSTCGGCKPGGAKTAPKPAESVAVVPASAPRVQKTPPVVQKPAPLFSPEPVCSTAAAAPAPPAPSPASVTDPMPARVLVEQRAADLGRTRERPCEECGEPFRPKPGPGRAPLYCPSCRAKPRRERAPAVGRTETRTCDYALCGATFTHKAKHGAIPRYCTPTCARQAENDARRERERLARIDAGMQPRQHLLEDVIRIRVTAEQRAAMQAAADRDGLELSQWLRQLALRAAGALPAAAPAPATSTTVRGCIAKLADGSWWMLGPLSSDASHEDALREARDCIGDEAISAHVFEVVVPTVLAGSVVLDPLAPTGSDSKGTR
jgi:hypothetical protein